MGELISGGAYKRYKKPFLNKLVRNKTNEKHYQEAFSTKWSVIQLLYDTINRHVFQFTTPTKKT